jgi:putative membrane protein
MSIRSYQGPLAGRGSLRSHRWGWLPWALFGATVALQIAYPLTEGATRTDLTIVTVAVFFLASTSHALIHRGLAWTAGFLAITVGGGLFVEAVGSTTDIPFGPYFYSGTLGAKVLGVPVVIPLAWAMMAYPSFLVARRLVRRRLAIAFVGGVALASWDLFLDPMMVAEGHWIWEVTTPALPGIEGIPAQNFAGWLLTGVVMMALLTLLPERTADDRMPIAVWLWVYVSSVLANAVFLGRPSVALVGGVVMGLVAIPLIVTLARDRA